MKTFLLRHCLISALLAAACSFGLVPSARATVNFTQIRTKTYGPFAFEKVATGDFFGIGVASVAVMKQAHSQIILMNTTSGTTTINTLGSFDPGTATGYDIEGMAAGDIDGDGKAELIVLRNAATSPDPNVLVYKLSLTVNSSTGVTSVGATLFASLRIGGGTYDWRGVACGDFDGDGKDEIVVCKSNVSQFIIYGVSGTSIVQKGFVNLPAGGTTNGINDWRGLAIGDLDHDGSPELVAVREASGTDPDVLVYKIGATGTSWSFNPAGTFNSTTHFSWVGATIGEYDDNPADGKELMLCKNTSSFFNFYSYVNSTTMNTLAGLDFQSDTADPWTAVASGKMSLRADGDCIVSIRQSAPSGKALEGIYGDESTLFAGKKAALQKNGFSWGTYHQAIFRNATDNSLDVPTLVAFIAANKLETFEPMVADFWDNGAGTYIQGREYVSIVALIDALATAGSPCKIIPLLVPPSEISGDVHYTPYPGDSPLIGAAELGGGVTDERTLFGTAPDYAAWFKLFGIIAKKYPNNVAGISVDDFSTLSNRNTFTRQKMGQMIANLRLSTNTVAFMPVTYYGLLNDANSDYFKDYVDGFVFYERNEKTKNATLIVPPDVTRTGSDWNMHGAIVLPSSDIAGGLNLANTEIGDVAAYVGNANSLLYVGIYATSHSQSTTAPTAFTTDALMKVVKANANCQGLMIYTTQRTTTAIGMAVYADFATWYGP